MKPEQNFFNNANKQEMGKQGFMKQLYNSKLNSDDEKEVFIGK